MHHNLYILGLRNWPNNVKSFTEEEPKKKKTHSKLDSRRKEIQSQSTSSHKINHTNKRLSGDDDGRC
ncbi:hypothetical protein AAHA92_00333 [Salvia divinorum]|uniref:Uncharacterized protein n=1 Tax=Salvia divinorum TaxID=28513 RepID=A0ABD1IJ65_SALDI